MRRLLIVAALFAPLAVLNAADLDQPTGEDIVSPDAKLELLYTRTADITGGLTEGVCAAPDGSMYFTDICIGQDKSLIVRFDPQTMECTVFSDDAGKANGLMCDARGFIIACEGSDYGGRRVARYNPRTG